MCQCWHRVTPINELPLPSVFSLLVASRRRSFPLQVLPLKVSFLLYQTLSLILRKRKLLLRQVLLFFVTNVSFRTFLEVKKIVRML